MAPTLTLYGQPGEIVLTGTVTNFDVGKSIEINAKGVVHKYDLNDGDIQYSISPEVATGTTVTVTERTDETTRKTITISPATKTKVSVDPIPSAGAHPDR